MESAVPRRVSLQMKMLIGFLVGLAAGLAVNMTRPTRPGSDAVITYVTGPIGQIFLRLLFMLVIPLLFSALVVGIAEMGDVRSLKRVGIKTLVFTVLLSSIAVRHRARRHQPVPARRRRRSGAGPGPARRRAASGASAIIASAAEQAEHRRPPSSTSSPTTSSPPPPTTTSSR